MHIVHFFQGESSPCPLSIVTASDTFLSVCHKVMKFCCQRKLKETQYFSSNCEIKGILEYLNGAVFWITLEAIQI